MSSAACATEQQTRTQAGSNRRNQVGIKARSFRSAHIRYPARRRLLAADWTDFALASTSTCSGRMSNADANFIDVRGISKAYGGVRALSDVSVQIARGEVHALCGENGAGKS